MSPEQARKFAQEWVAAWNTHDVTKLMTYCAEEFEMSSPLVSDVGAGASGTVKGREAVASTGATCWCARRACASTWSTCSSA